MIDTNAKSGLGAVLVVALAAIIGGCGSDSAVNKAKAGGTESVAAIPLSEEQSLKGAFTHENLSFALIVDASATDDTEYLTLDEGLLNGGVMVWEKGGADGRDNAEVQELEIENRTDFPVYLQAGDVVKGGKQDRTIVADLIIPPNSGRMPIASFCVEQGRWSGASLQFRASKLSAHTPALKMAIQAGDQREVWNEVAEATRAVGAETRSGTLYAALAHTEEDIEKYSQALKGIVDQEPKAVGFVVAVNGEPVAADLYGNPGLFRKMWPKLLSSYALHAVGQRSDNEEGKTQEVTLDACRAFLAGATKTEREESISGDVVLEVRSSDKVQGFHYRRGDKLLHMNLNAKRD